MRNEFLCAAFACASLMTVPVKGSVIYNNLTPNNLMAVATRPDTGGPFEIEAADDFVTNFQTTITSASFTGLLVPSPTGGPTTISDVVLEMYRVFPLDSDTTRTPNVPTRTNSPSDVAFATRDSAGGDLTFDATFLGAGFTTLNSVQPGGIHPSPGQTTGGNGSLSGIEIQIDVTLTNPFNLPPDHFFFVPQVALTNGGTFYWLSASRPISGSGTTAFSPDLQAWTRDAMLDPDWLRVGTDIVGGQPAPMFNMAFQLQGTAIPEPATTLLIGLGIVAVSLGYKQTMRNRR